MCLKLTYIYIYIFKKSIPIRNMDSRTKAFHFAAELSKSRKCEDKPSWLLCSNSRDGTPRTVSSRKGVLVSVSELVKGVGCKKTAHAFLAARAVMEMELVNKNNRKIKLIGHLDVPTNTDSLIKNTKPKTKCASMNMSGKPCKFTATHGKYCKRHMVVDNDIF